MVSLRSLQRAISLSAAGLFLCCAAVASAGEPSSNEAIEPLVAEVLLNGKRLPQHAIFLKDAAGRLYASDAFLRESRLKLPETSTVRFEGETYHCVNGVPSLSAALAEADQAIVLEAAPTLFHRQGINFTQSTLPSMTNSADGSFINYDLFAERTSGNVSLNGAVDLNLFTRWGAGFSNFVGQAGEGQRRLLRLDTNWTIDRPDGLTSVRLGDGITRGGPGGAPLRFGGIQFARNFSVQPGFVTIPLPTVSGSAALPSVAEVYVNSVLQGSRELEPGPFEFRQTPVQTGGGTIQLVANDVLGRQIVSTQQYYTSAEMLRKGLHDFSYEVGFLREDFGARSNRYGKFIASAVHRYGFSNKLTGEASLQLAKSHQTAGAALTATVFDLALVSAGTRVSQSNRGQGGAATLGVERRSRLFSFGARAEWRTEHYRLIGEPENRRSRLTAFAFADYSFRRGAVGFNYYHRGAWTGEEEELIGGFANLAVRGATVHLSARRAISGPSNTIFGATLALPVGPRRSVAGSLDVERGRRLTRFSVQQNSPAATGARYRAAFEDGDGNAFHAEYVWQGPQATWGVAVAKAKRSEGVRLSLSGALGLIGDRPFASNRLNSSFAEVKVDGHSGVRVYADNQLVGVTGAGGRLIVPNLRAYEANALRIDDADLPLDAQLASFSTVVRPYARSGVTVRFTPKTSRGVLMRVRLSDGGLLPAGAKVTVVGRRGSHVVVAGGELYIEGITGTERLRAQWKGRSCVIDITVPATADPQPLLDDLVCRREQHASR